MKSKIVFVLTEEVLKRMIWDAKNYGRTQEEFEDVTPKELAAAKALLKDDLADHVQEMIVEAVQREEVA